MESKKIRVLIAGIGGASLGTEVLKCLLLAHRYDVYGCDISPLAYGHYQDGFEKTFLVNPEEYIAGVKKLCIENGIQVIVPGGEQPMVFLGAHQDEFEGMSVKFASNSARIINLCSNKDLLFDYFQNVGIASPKTVKIQHISEFSDFPCPCVIKPASGTGGSSMVFLAATKEEARQYLVYILNSTQTALIQEYVPVDEGEFTIGVLSLPGGKLAGTIALKRMFNAKLSVMSKTKTGLISSGYSQGLIASFPELCVQAEKIALTLNSQGPVNIQARVRNGKLLPFEINPRFSASTYLRALAGFNEIDIFIQYLVYGIEVPYPVIHPGYYLRSLDEVYVPLDGVKV